MTNDNPKCEQEKKPKIYLSGTKQADGLFYGKAIAEDGDFLTSHISSDEDWSKHDLGYERSTWQHETYYKKYPNGFELIWGSRPIAPKPLPSEPSCEHDVGIYPSPSGELTHFCRKCQIIAHKMHFEAFPFCPATKGERCVHDGTDRWCDYKNNPTSPFVALKEDCPECPICKPVEPSVDPEIIAHRIIYARSITYLDQVPAVIWEQIEKEIAEALKATILKLNQDGLQLVNVFKTRIKELEKECDRLSSIGMNRIGILENDLMNKTIESNKQIATANKKAEKLAEHLKEICNAVATMNFGKNHAVRVKGDDEPVYQQRHEWCAWIFELKSRAEQALKEYRGGE